MKKNPKPSEHSDLWLLTQFLRDRESITNKDDLFRVLSAGAAHNLILPEESLLSAAQRKVIELRRSIILGQRSSSELLAETTLIEEAHGHESPLYKADLQVLKGNLLQRLGDFQGASAFHRQSSRLFQSIGDGFRSLRSLINSQLFVATEAKAYQTGELRLLLQEAQRCGYYDLCGHIHRGLALELFIEGRYAEARLAIHEALKNYRLLSFPDDESIAHYLSSLIWLHLNNGDKAKVAFDRASIRTGKAKPYFEAAKACLVGMTPKLPLHHPLTRAKWSQSPLRRQALPFRIIELLKRQGPLGRDEIIYQIWGETATSEAYCNRLYVILNQIRKKQMAQILFNGAKYQLMN